ncbi:hypothetical protein [Micromonospora sp. NPDC004551]|uniref:hypothetical protein n=1 Tax=Micromonospora sp. NPDC004551 TaxID=3154284 RepID=UPI0033BBF7F7
MQEDDSALLPDRVRQFLDCKETDLDLVKEYLARLLDTCETMAREARRNWFVAVSLALVFILISGRGVSEVSILAVKLTDFAFIRILIPPVAVGLVVRAVQISWRRQTALSVYYEITKHRFPGLSKSDLDTVVVSSAFLFSVGGGGIDDGTRYGRLMEIIESAETFICIVLLPAFFALYSFYRLFVTYGYGNAFVWVSLAATGALLVLLFLSRGGPEVYPFEEEEEEVPVALPKGLSA